MRALGKFRATLKARTVAVGLSLITGLGPTGYAFGGRRAADPATGTPIQHLVVIFQENVSFDHYFATYPNATNPSGEPSFQGSPNTPSINGLSGVLLSNNPNQTNPANVAIPMGANPFRLDRSQVATCDQGHNYKPEELAFDLGLMDNFPLGTGVTGCVVSFDYSYGHGQGLVMGYFDGNTVTALWNYAQSFAMSDNSYSTMFGPSTPGVLNLVAGNTYPATPSAPSTKVVPNNLGPGSLIGDLDPTGDVCSSGTTVSLGGSNVGDLLNDQGVTWGWFEGGFDLTAVNSDFDNSTGCNRDHPASTGGTQVDYIPHHQPFQYYASTANPMHTRPNAVKNIGTSSDGGAKHQYDLHDFFDALNAGIMPAVSFLKASGYQDGHAGYSDPLKEQTFIVNTINTIEKSKFWGSTAIIIAYDDSDGWYDHQMSPIVNPSATVSDAVSGAKLCGNGIPFGGIQGRCGYGPRQPLLVVSPWAKANFVDHGLSDQSSILRFIEDNWNLGQIGGGSFDAFAGTLDNMFDFSVNNGASSRRLFLNPDTGE
jgi:phospholipase C